MDTGHLARCFFFRNGFLVWFSPWFPAVQRLSLGDHFPEGNEEEEANDFPVTLLKTNSSHLKMVVSNRNLLFQGSIFRCYVSSREGKPFFWEFLRGILWSTNPMEYWNGSVHIRKILWSVWDWVGVWFIMRNDQNPHSIPFYLVKLARDLTRLLGPQKR